MNLHTIIFTNNNCYKAGKTIFPKGIMVHSTGANNPNLKRYVGPDDGLLGNNIYGNHWNTAKPGNQEICCHAFIGKLQDGTIATYQTLPWNHRGWHAGGSANNTHIGFEICEDNLTDRTYFNTIYKEAVELCVYLCKLYSLNEKDVICHAEGYKKGIASNHGDVLHWFSRFGKSMDDFRADVKAGLAVPVTNTPKKYYRVQLGAFTVKENAEMFLKNVKDAGFDAFTKFDGKHYRIQVGAFTLKKNADAFLQKIKAAGFPDAFIKYGE